MAIQNQAAEVHAENVVETLRNQSTVIWDTGNLTIRPAIYSTGSGEVRWGPWWS